MYLSNTLMLFFLAYIVLMVVFIATMIRIRQITLIHKFYFAAAVILIVWLIALILMRFTDPDNMQLLSILDAVTTLGGAFIPPCLLLFVICYTKEYERGLPKRYWLVFVIPVITTLVIFTNRYHHLYYKVFALDNNSVQFGPYFLIHSAYAFACVVLSVVFIVRFALKTKTRLHLQQAVLFTIGSLAPSVVNLLVLTRVINATIATTPVSFIITMVLHGIIIFRLHFFDIKPIAMQELVNWIGDCYLVLSQTGLVVSYNQPFMRLLGEKHGVRENILLQSCVQNEDVENKTALYNLLNALQACRENNSRVTYEQSVNVQRQGETTTCFYIAEVTPLTVKEETAGFLAIFKDVTQLKTNMQKLQDNQVKMMERERLAFLGQMAAGLAHNLKTPIMSISGSVSAVENLIQECRDSLTDPEVTTEDYQEIYQEMAVWLQRMRESCAYMSDIITAVKGQAGSMNASDTAEFSLADAFQRVSLLLRHELLSSGCTLKILSDFRESDILIQGDINNLVQVISNLVSNAIDAQLPDRRHDILADVRQEDELLQITITDFGCGIPEKVKGKLFQQMITSKGTHGTGLGIFISDTVIRARFGGRMWFEDNPEGGTVWGIGIPLEHITFVKTQKR